MIFVAVITGKFKSGFARTEHHILNGMADLAAAERRAAAVATIYTGYDERTVVVREPDAGEREFFAQHGIVEK